MHVHDRTRFISLAPGYFTPGQGPFRDYPFHVVDYASWFATFGGLTPVRTENLEALVPEGQLLSFFSP